MGVIEAPPFSSAVRKLRKNELVTNARVRYESQIPVVISVLCDISNPWKCLISTLFDNLEVSNLDPRYSEIWYLEFHCYWCTLFVFILWIQIRQCKHAALANQEINRTIPYAG